MNLSEYLSEFGASSAGAAAVRSDAGRARLVVQPVSKAPAAWAEKNYAQQDAAYVAERLPIFTTRLERLEVLTNALDAEFRSRISTAKELGMGSERGTLAMPIPGGRCPASGPLAYVYKDLFEQARANLADLGFEKPPRTAAPELVNRWLILVERNIGLLRLASNINPIFQFPLTGEDPGYPSVRWRSGATETLQSRVGGFERGQEAVMRAGAPYPHPGAGTSEPQAVRDLRKAYATALANAKQVRGYQDSGTRWYGDLNAPDAPPLPTGNTREDLGGNAFLRPRVIQPAVSADERRIIQWAWDSDQLTLERPGAGRWIAPRLALAQVQDTARAWSRVSLMQMLADALGWYTFNHNVWYADKLGLTVEQLRGAQQATIALNLTSSSVNAGVVGVTIAVATAINPVFGVIAAALNAIGVVLLTSLIRVEPDMPKMLFMRVPDPSCRQITPEEVAAELRAQTTCPEGTRGTPPNCRTIAPGTSTCPQGTVGTPPNCLPVAVCPAGTTGTPPNCLPIPAAVCPAGTTGTPPNCVTIPTEKKGGGGTLFFAAAAAAAFFLMRRS